jgi:alpha-glucosidase
MRPLLRTVVSTLVSLLPLPAVAAGPIQINRAPAELIVAQVGGRTVRVTLAPLDEQGRPRPDPASTVLVPFESVEKLRVRELADAREVQAGRLVVRIQSQPLTVTIRRPDGRVVQELVFDEGDGSVRFRTEAPVFGLGEGRQQFDRRGFFYNFVNGQTTFLATHSATIPVPFLVGADGWSMFVHNPPPPTTSPREANRPWLQFDLRGENAGPPPANGRPAELLKPPEVLPTRGRIIPQAASLGRAPMHVFVSALDGPADAMEELVRLTGRPVMPPKWVMGYMQSHRSLAGPQEVIDVARTFREKQLPCDALIYLGTGYTNGPTGWNLGHGSLEFNPRVFDKPQAMLDQLHGMNFKVVLHKNAAPARLYGNSVNEPSDDPLHIRNYWATHVPLAKMGVDGWWPDDGDELPVEARLARHRLYYEGSLQVRPGERPWSLNRNGYAGAARYGAWIWSGDVQSRWVTLANHVPVGLNFSLSVSPFWGSDTGGFFLAPRNEYTGELYVRWFQFAAFTPLFRSHGRNWHLHTPWGWNAGEIGPRESGERADYPPDDELRNAAVEPVCKKYLDLRYQLLPYNYTLAREACDTGLPPMRALLLAYPDDPEAVKLGDEYLWGPNILVAPVTEKGATTRRLYLPKGRWHDWWTGEATDGPRWVDRPVDLATLPLYARAGAIVPLDPVRQYTAQTVDEPTTVRIFPGADGTFTLYDDDGHSTGYQDGSDARTVWLRFHWDDAGRRLAVEPDPRMKRWPGGVRAFRAQLAGSAAIPTPVEFDGTRVEIRL